MYHSFITVFIKMAICIDVSVIILLFLFLSSKWMRKKAETEIDVLYHTFAGKTIKHMLNVDA